MLHVVVEVWINILFFCNDFDPHFCCCYIDDLFVYIDCISICKCFNSMLKLYPKLMRN